VNTLQKLAVNSAYLKTQKTSGHPLVNRLFKINKWINRPLAWPLVQLLKKTKITPNQVSVASFIIGMAGALCFIMGSYKWFIFGGILAQLSSIVDNADGMLARAKNMGTEFGKYLDLFLDRIIDFSLVAALSYGLYRSTGRSFLLILGLLACALYYLHISLYYITIKYFNNNTSGETGELRSFLLFSIFFFALINRMDIGLWVFLGFGIIITCYNIIYFLRLPKVNTPLT
jgi:phosphatidylglycerophosphate synthase